MRARNGFTLIEVLAAVAILGVGLVILLDAHYSALRVNTETIDAVVTRQLLESVVSQAEVEVLAGNLSGGDAFGPRHPGYTWEFEAIQDESNPDLQLYGVNVSVTGPSTTETLEFWVYNPALGDYTTGTLSNGTPVGGAQGTSRP